MYYHMYTAFHKIFLTGFMEAISNQDQWHMLGSLSSSIISIRSRMSMWQDGELTMVKGTGSRA